MAIIGWQDAFSVGIEEIDAQHRKLIDIINNLHEAMRDKKAKGILGDIVNEMADYATLHFATEEKYLVAFGYPEIVVHESEHNAFTKKVADLRERLAQGTLVLSLEVITFLRDWLTNHILSSDKKYAPFLNSKGLQ
ncbi:MAG: hemerythrin [Deltaproteobacteria bacterium RIFOXYA12_FULL_58_15]|nr:MAG: hemerythrin [Deltaproteobacteria bacterium RIFOXYA12_FULL_58_15]OGR07353.1 MAG: hemerythrin [Deltaproteobacteria bacterium RIFOXYB12_FULL_58_9]